MRKRSAGVVVLRHHPTGWRVLLLRAWRNWDFPKGEIEPGEDPLAAARRETLEEAGIRDLAFPWGHAFVETEPYAGGKIARYYIGVTNQLTIDLPVSPELGRPEHHEARWFDFGAARTRLVPRLQRVLDWAREISELEP